MQVSAVRTFPDLQNEEMVKYPQHSQVHQAHWVQRDLEAEYQANYPPQQWELPGQPQILQRV